MSNRRSAASTPVAVLVLLLALLGGGVLIWILLTNRPPRGAEGLLVDQSQPRRSAAISRELLELKNRSLGHLENKEYRQAEELLIELEQELPIELFALRNLAVAQELALQEVPPGNAAALATEGEKCLVTLDRLQTRDAKSGVPELLRARVLRKLGRLPEALVAARQAAERDGTRADFWYEVFQIADEQRSEPTAEAVLAEALQKAYELAPDNLFLMKDWLPYLARKKDASIVGPLARYRDDLKPFAETIKAHVRLDVVQSLQDAEDAARAEKWNEVLLKTVRSVNVIKPEPVAQSDRLLISRHSLEYALLDFQPETLATLDLAIPKTDRVTVKYEPWPLTVPELAEIRELLTLDWNLDGKWDLAVLQAGRLSVLTPHEAEWRELARIELPGDYTGFVAADLDDDVELPQASDLPLLPGRCHQADPDFVLFGPSGLLLVETRQPEQQTPRSLQIVEANPAWKSLTGVRCAVLIDFDHEGDLDVVAAGDQGISLWRNLGNRTFDDASGRSQLPPDTFRVTAMTVVDFDRDMDLDLILAGDGSAAGLLENLRYGRMRYKELPQDFAELKSARRLFAAEVDGNGSWDLMAQTPSTVGAVLTQSSPAGSVSSLRSESLGAELFDAQVADYDNDGALDWLGVSDSGLEVYRGSLAPSWGPEFAVKLPNLDVGSRIALGDWDQDRDLDVVVAAGNTLTMLRNEGGNQNHVLEIALRAQQNKGADPTASGRVNHFGIGSLVEAKAGPQYQAAVVSGQVTRFGLGQQMRADVLRVVWTSGIPRNLIHPMVDEFLCEEQKLEGSCPYLYTWNGERFVFHTDLLWAAPIGLKFGESVIAPWREWEYLKVDGDRLKPKDGRYELRITEELWEASYFDEVKLYAVAHPPDVQIYTNEKVGPPALAERKIFTVRQPRYPVAATDPEGRNQLPLIRARDDQYAKTWKTKLKQGLTNPHWMEIDLGTLESPKQVLLYLTGWVYPTDTAINVSLSQNPDLPEAKPPSLWAPDGAGGWKEVRPFMGFPGGKTKTIVVDVTDALTPGDGRLRIATNMEFYWDEIFCTVDEETAPYQEFELPLVSAELRDRGGVSATIIHPQYGPDRYHYEKVLPGAHWAPVDGHLTRFGDVLELLRERDDRHVVFMSGEEMALSFATLQQPLPEGWVLDFVIYNVGWDKDFNMNTVYGQHVEPLPFREMTDYAYRDGDERPQDDIYRAYLRQYQSREQARGPFWDQTRRWKD